MKKTLSLLTLCLTAGLALSLSYPFSAARAQEVLSLDAAKIDLLGIRTARPEPVAKVWSLAYPSQVSIPNNQIRVLTSLYPGLIKTLHVAEGDRMRRGQPVAEIASPAFLQAQQEYLDAVTALDMAQKNFKRDSLLRDEGIISEKRFLMARTELSQARNTHARQEQALRFAGLDDPLLDRLKQSRQIIPALTLTAPFDGIVLQQMGRVGEKIDEASALYSIGQVSPLWLEIHVPLPLSRNITTGGHVKITDPTREGSAIEGKVISVGRMIHGVDQGVLVRAEIREGADRLVPGQFAAVQVEQNFEARDAYRLPQQAIIRDAAQTYVFRRSAKGFTLLPVIILAEEQDSVIIRAVLNDGDRLRADDRLAISGTGSLKGMWQGLGSEE